MTPNFEAHYEELTEIESDPRYLRLCAMQMKARTSLASKQARERVQLAIAIRQERETP